MDLDNLIHYKGYSVPMEYLEERNLYYGQTAGMFEPEDEFDIPFCWETKTPEDFARCFIEFIDEHLDYCDRNGIDPHREITKEEKKALRPVPLWPSNLYRDILGEDVPLPESWEEDLEHVMNQLKEKEKAFLYQRYRYGLTFRRIGKSSGISQQGARQIIVKAVQKLKKKDSVLLLAHGQANYAANLVKQEEMKKSVHLSKVAEKYGEDSPEYATAESCRLYKITESSLCNRTVRCLTEQGYEYLHELLPFEEDKFLQIPSFGKKCIQELKTLMVKMMLDESLYEPSVVKKRGGRPREDGPENATAERWRWYKITESNLSKRTVRCLTEQGFEYLHEFLPFEEEKLLQIPGLGTKSLHELRTLMIKLMLDEPTHEPSAVKNRGGGQRISLGWPENLIARAFSKSEIPEGEIEKSSVEAALDSLPENYKKILYARFKEGRTISSIAAELGLTVSSIAVQERKATVMLRAPERSSILFHGKWGRLQSNQQTEFQFDSDKEEQ